jgi:hypothetical protein
VQYHFICIVGITDAGYICNDGDNSAISQHLVTYTWQQIENARPCGVLVIEMEQGATPVGIPAGWTDDGTTLRSPDKTPVTLGFRSYILANPWNPADIPLGAAGGVSEVELMNTSHGAGTIQYFRFSQLSWTPQDGVFISWVGAEAQFLRGTVGSLQAQVKQLTDELAAAKAQPPVVQQVPTPIDPAVRQALQSAAQALAPQVTIAQELADALGKL